VCFLKVIFVENYQHTKKLTPFVKGLILEVSKNFYSFYA